MLINILIALAALIAVFVIFVALQPSESRVARTAAIAAPAAVVFAHVNDFRKWRTWSPYDKLDPQMQKNYAGAPSGTGAIYSWIGNNQAGVGRATITESRPGELVRVRLDFEKPFAGTSTAEFTFKPDGDRTAVTWSYVGRNNFVCKAIGLFTSMDKWIGGQFEEGLGQLKSVVEGAHAR